jgi:hypothetical protein
MDQGGGDYAVVGWQAFHQSKGVTVIKVIKADRSLSGREVTLHPRSLCSVVSFLSVFIPLITVTPFRLYLSQLRFSQQV